MLSGIERAIRQEDDREKRKQAGEFSGDVNVLFPVRLDDFIFNGGEHERKVDVRRGSLPMLEDGIQTPTFMNRDLSA